MNKVSCGVCMDLMPLVKDGMASEDSCTLVREHLLGCEHCAKAFGEQNATVPVMDDTTVLRKIKLQLALILFGAILAGTLIGMLLSDGPGLFYNALIMPVIGAFGYLLLKRRAYYIPAGLFLFSFIWVSIREIVRGSLSGSNVAELLTMAFWWSSIFALLAAVGVLIAGLFHYACKKER